MRARWAGLAIIAALYCVANGQWWGAGLALLVAGLILFAK